MSNITHNYNNIKIKLDDYNFVYLEKINENYSKLIFYDNYGDEIDVPTELKLYCKLHNKYLLSQYTLRKLILYYNDNYKIIYDDIEIFIKNNIFTYSKV